MNIIVIDCGASFVKAALIAEGRIVQKKQLTAPPVRETERFGKGAQMDHILKMVRELILELGKGEGSVGLCISNEMHGFLLAEEEGGLLTDYISWQKEYGSIVLQDGRTALEKLSEKEYEEEIYWTGMPLRAGLPSCNLLYLAESGVLDKAAGKLFFYTLGDYILHVLSGKEAICHETNAAATGLYDFRKKNWNDKLIRRICGNREVIFPEIGKRTVSFLLEGIHITAYPAIGDQQAALLGAGLNRDTDISFNLGTGAQVSGLAEQFEREGVCQIRPFFNGRYLKTIPHIPSGRAINVFIRFIKDILASYGAEIPDSEVWEVALNAAKSCDGTEMVCDMSFFENAVTGYTKGSLTQIGEYSLTLSELMYSILDTMVENYVSVSKKLCRREEVKRIIFSGGIARRIAVIREGIEQSFPETEEVLVAEDETLTGLYLYSQMDFDEEEIEQC